MSSPTVAHSDLDAAPNDAAAAASCNADDNAPQRSRGVKFAEEPDVQVHTTSETNAEGEGMLRLHGRRSASGHSDSENDEDDDFDPNDPEDVARHQRLLAASQNKSINEESVGSLRHRDSVILVRERNEAAAHAPSSPPASQARADVSSPAAAPLQMHHLLGSPTLARPKHSELPPSPPPPAAPAAAAPAAAAPAAAAPPLQPVVDASQLVQLLQAKLSSGELSAESLARILPQTAASPPAANVDSLVAELALLRQQVLHLVKRQEVLETENHSLHSQLTAQVSPPRAQSASRASTAMSSLANTMHAPVKAAAAVGETKFDNVKGEWWQLPLSDAVTQGLFDQSSHVCMYIEHCYDCKAHASTTRHDPENYEGRAEAMKQLFLEQFNGIVASVFCEVNSVNGKRFMGRLGSFEVCLAWTSQCSMHKTIVFSKLQALRFPNISATILRMFRLFPCPLSPVSLRFIDAVTGAAVKHSVVTVYAVAVPAEVTLLKTDGDGRLQVSLPNLRHRFICAAANYCETTVELLPSKSGVETGVPMSPSLKQDCVRAVLTWREHPQDLDLHCLTSNCHVFHESSNCPDGSVVLEKDVRNGFGPETILLNLPFKGTCHFFVHLYDGVGTLGGCGATLRIFGSNGPIASFDVPPAPAQGAEKPKFWYVAKSDNGIEWKEVGTLMQEQPTYGY